MELYADIILPVPIRRLFTYRVPQEMADQVTVGSRVVVQFGRKKSYSGIIHALHHNKPQDYDVKDVSTVVDSSPIVVEQQTQLWSWISDYYICSMGEVSKAALPSGLKLESETKLSYNELYEPSDVLTEKQERLLTFIRNKRTCLISDLASAFDDFNPLPTLKHLLDAEAVVVSEEMRDGYKPKTETHLSVAQQFRNERALSEAMDNLERAPKQLEALMVVIQRIGGMKCVNAGQSVKLSQVLEDKRVTSAAISELVKKGICEKLSVNVSRLADSAAEAAPNPLSEVQQKALDDIELQHATKDVVLLHGVTSSGKTEVYIHLINKYLAAGKQVLYLLPEIALTTQITSRLRRHFGSQLGVYHSKFSDAERVEVWNRLLTKQYQIILGVRSSVLLPFSDLGLVIVDEEHETTFKQYDPAPRYHARDAACVLAKIHSAKTLLGSATPSLESYHNAMSDKYGYVTLTQRYEGIELPEIVPVDMREARKKHTFVSMFSFALKDEIDRTLEKGEQVILFQNRRGFAPYVECTQCAWIAKCVNCDVSMTYHKGTNRLVCHYCTYSVEMPRTCAACGSPTLEAQGYGTEKIEEEVKAVFPKAEVVRMDLDTARSRKSFEKIIADFEEKKYNILIGTQMVSKGLDFAGVTQVGVLNADNLLNMPDFRAYERAYQLMAQVSGRAGRRDKRGKVFLQTRDVENPVIRNLLSDDFATHARQQLAEREAYSYPPFFRLINIAVRHKEQQMAQNAAYALALVLREVFQNRVLGPQAPYISRISTYYIQRITLKIEKNLSPQKMKALMMDCVDKITTNTQFKGISVSIDVDPY